MRRFKSLLRLAMDKGLGRNTRKRPDAQTHRGEPAPGDHQDKASRLLGDEPPTRILQ